MALFDVLFGWRKASKCKKLIRRVQFRLRLLRNKRDSIVRQSRSDVSRLVQLGYLDIATQRAEQLLKDMSVMELYDLLNHFCEFIITNLSYIRRHRECPNDLNEAVSSLIFASARCGELPELRRIRELFRERYGESFALTAVNQLPGNLVNTKIIDRLSLKSISNDSKLKLVDEFARDQLRDRGQPEILAIEYAVELHKQIEEMAERQTICLEIVPISSETVVDLKEGVVTVTKVEKKAISTDLVATENGLHVAKSQSRSSRGMNSTRHKVDDFDLVAAPCKLRTAVSCAEEKESGVGLEKASEQREGMVSSSSSVESSPHLADLKVVYLDDVEELQSRSKHDEGVLDQRFFKFKPSIVPKSTKPWEIVADGYAKQYEPSEKEDLSPRVTRKNKAMPGKRLRRRPVSREPECIQDSESAAYYNERNGNPKKHLMQSPMKAQDRSLNSKENNNPQPGKVIATQQETHCNCCEHSKSGDHKVFYVKPNRAKGFRGKSDVLLDHSLDTDASTSSDSEEDEGLLLPSYLRAMTMPPRRQTVQLEGDGGRMSRSNSFPYQPNHVHPKLPDYEELAARFSALKEEYLGTRTKPRIIGKHLQK